MTNRAFAQSMTMRYPATRWQDALPTGSGVVGALLYGNLQNDTILLNHEALFFPKTPPAVIDVSDQLAEVRRLIRAGNCREAAQLMPRAYAERADETVGSTSKGRDPYQPFCAIRLGMSTDGPFRNYRRGVDFTSGRAWVQWTDNTATYTREVFVSRLTDTVFLRIRSNEPGTVACRLSLNKVRNEQSPETTFANTKVEDIEYPSESAASADDQSLHFTARYPLGCHFGARGQVTAAGGSLQQDDDTLVIGGADEIVLQLRLFLNEDPDTALPRLASEMAQGPAFESAFAEHRALHEPLFNRTTLCFGNTVQASNEEMLMDAYEGNVPNALIQTLFALGRYLLICSSRPGSWPANLQGVWNGDYAPAWNSDYHNDENIQMNYWQALPGQLPEAILPLFDYFETHLDDFRANARNIFGCGGIYVPIAMTTHGREIPCTWSNWTAAAGWLGQYFHDYYLFTGDLEFLEQRAVPWLKEVALFYEDFLLEDERGKLRFIPSLSPENRPSGSNSLLAINATMDVAVCREVLSNLCEACDRLGIEQDAVPRWRSMLAKLPDYEINEDGAIKEWLHPDFIDNYHHRHQSHIYPVFPGLEVTEESAAELYEACRVAVEKRLVIGLTSQTGWSMAHMANIYARLGQGNRALDCLELLSRSSTGPNLFTYHNDWRQMGLTCGWGQQPPFQIDANFGFTAAVLEMLVFSKPGLIKLLPALPDKWSTGRVTGIACRGGITVDMEWHLQASSFSATLTSKRDQTLRVHLPTAFSALRSDAAAAPAPRDTGQYWDITLEKDKPLQIPPA